MVEVTFGLLYVAVLKQLTACNVKHMDGVTLIFRVKCPYPHLQKNHVLLFFAINVAKSKVVVGNKVGAAAETVSIFGIVRFKP